MNGLDQNESVCVQCHHLFNVITGLLVKGWERAFWVTAPAARAGEPDICDNCKGALIETLQKAVPT